MIELIKVTEVKTLEAFRLHLRFSNGFSGVHDFTDIVGETGPMVEPLRNNTFFKSVFLSLGALTWPNGYDLDSIRLHDEMKMAGELNEAAAALNNS